MTKQQEKQVGFAKAHICYGNTDSAAKIMSALIRCCANNKQAQELQSVASELNLTNHPEFTI